MLMALGEGVVVGAIPGYSSGILRQLVHISADQEAERPKVEVGLGCPQGLSPRYSPLPASAHLLSLPKPSEGVPSPGDLVFKPMSLWETLRITHSSHLGGIHCWDAWANGVVHECGETESPCGGEICGRDKGAHLVLS